MIKNFIDSGQFGRYQSEQSRQISMFKTLCSLGVCFFVAFGTIMAFDHKWLVAATDLCMVLILILLNILINRTQNPMRIQLIGVLCLGSVLIFLFFSKEAHGVGFFWYFSYPLLTAFLLGARMGALLTTLVILITLGLIALIGTDYSFAFLLRFFATFGAVGLLSYIYEQTRAQTEALLIQKNKRLNTMIRELTLTEQSYRESRQKYQDLVETIRDWIWEIDAKGKFVYSSPQLENILGYTAEEIIGKGPAGFIQPDFGSQVEPLIAEILLKKEIFTGLEAVLSHRRGQTVVLETNGVPILDDCGALSGYRCVTRDITIRKQAQKEHAEREKLHGALELAGAVCHELNQPMMVINGYAEILMTDNDIIKNQRLIGSLAKIQKQMERMGDITRKLMGITRYETRTYTGGEIIVDIDRSSTGKSSGGTINPHLKNVSSTGGTLSRK